MRSWIPPDFLFNCFHVDISPNTTDRSWPLSDSLCPVKPNLYAVPYIPGICYSSQLHICVRYIFRINPLTRIYHVVSVFAIRMTQMMAMQSFFCPWSIFLYEIAIFLMRFFFPITAVPAQNLSYMYTQRLLFSILKQGSRKSPASSISQSPKSATTYASSYCVSS